MHLSRILLTFALRQLLLLIKKTKVAMGVIVSLLLGCLAGFCAGKLMKGGGFGLIMNIVLGLLGGAVGGWLLPLLGVEWGGLLGQLATAIIGAVIILWVASFFKK